VLVKMMLAVSSGDRISSPSIWPSHRIWLKARDTKFR
jgi:hypothetical protein